ncbi:MAG TPA: immunoglobulin domain-containing protein [Verrucomicrobiae bacterium]|nr:immunoglobulin domain-containing protein [Verrucomicrobiae bacterium]
MLPQLLGLTAVLVTLCCFPAQAAKVIWSEPVTISNPQDVCTVWSLDRAYNLGAVVPATVNGVTFLPFNAPTLEDRVALPETIHNDAVEVAVSGDHDGFFAEQKQLVDRALVLVSDYRSLLESGLSDGGSAFALNLSGLTPGRSYLLQIWAHDSRKASSAETLIGGISRSSPVHFTSTGTSAGAGEYIIGMFVADAEQQSIAIAPDNGSPLINAFQLRVAPDNARLAIVKDPTPAANYAGKSVKLSALAAGSDRLRYQWQKVEGGKVLNLYDDPKFSGAATPDLVIHDLAQADVGDYRLLARDETNVIVSATAKVSLLQTSGEPLINVDINERSSPTYQGDGVLVENSGFDVWNGIDGRNGFTDVPLLDSAGERTPVTISLSKPREDGYTRKESQNDLFKDYSPASEQTITLNGLEPDSYYNLVVYSIGRAPNEGGVFSGAINGVVYGGHFESEMWISRFLPGTNYIQNPFTKSDSSGAIQFTIKATKSLFKDGFFNGDFNGLQLRKVATNNMAPYILQQPQSVAAYRNQPAVLRASAVGTTSSQLTYTWQKIGANNRGGLMDGNGIQGINSPVLTISNVTASTVGDYRVVIGGMPGSVTSRVATVSIMPSPRLINVDIKNGNVPVYDGRGVLSALGGNFWNGINGRVSFTDRPLLDNDSHPTAVTISLLKEQVDSYTSPISPNNLLKDYSVGHPQTVILKNLEPDTHYHLVVYSFGAMQHEGGVFSGAVKGIVHGWHGSSVGLVDRFVLGTNYIENASALTDARGTLSFTIQPTSTVDTNGFFNSDFNGLQIRRRE